MQYVPPLNRLDDPKNDQKKFPTNNHELRTKPLTPTIYNYYALTNLADLEIPISTNSTTAKHM